MRSFILAAALGCGAFASGAASAASFSVNLTELNGSGVSGFADLTLTGTSLKVAIRATGLEADQLHVQHIHGLFDADGAPRDSITPPPSADMGPQFPGDIRNGDMDGFVEVGEGAPFYGPVIVPLTPFTTAPGGVIDFEQTYDLTDPGVFAGGFDIDDLLPLTTRELVLHGLTVPAGVDPSVPNGGYLASLPVAAGEIEAFSNTPTAVPLPASAFLLIGGLGGLAALRRRRAA